MNLADEAQYLGRLPEPVRLRSWTAQVWIELLPEPGRGLTCSGYVPHRVHNCQLRRVRDLPILEAQSHLWVRRRRVLWVGRGRGRKDVRPFFELLGSEGRRSLRAAVMDMNGANAEEVRYQCPLAEIVYAIIGDRSPRPGSASRWCR